MPAPYRHAGLSVRGRRSQLLRSVPARLLIKPSALAQLPPLPNEDLDPDYTGGDLCVQACSDDPLVAFHAVRNPARIGMGVVEHNWMELGFGRTSTTTASQPTPRNLLGFKDGTRNIKAEQASLMNDHVWVGRETDQPWLRGGSYLVARKIRIFVENWDRDYLQDQENTIGRAKVSGAPLSGGKEFTTPDFAATGSDGQPAIPAHAHIRLASFEHNGGTRILRRGYSFTDGIDPQAGTLFGGLFFIAFIRTRPSSSGSSSRWPPTRSTSTPSTPAAPCSPAHPACAPGMTGAPLCSPDPSRPGLLSVRLDPPGALSPPRRPCGSAGRGSRGLAR
jgi:Dyp-type peroxidase family